jgi:flagellar biosynthesis anti-sigma factor FlgM
MTYLAGAKKNKGDRLSMDLYPNRSVSNNGRNHKQSTSDSDQSHRKQKPHMAGKEAIVLPSRATAIEQAQKIVREAPEMRKELIVQIKCALELGTLTLDSRLVAEKLLGIEIDDVCYAA